jgi:hypothetical protein
MFWPPMSATGRWCRNGASTPNRSNSCCSGLRDRPALSLSNKADAASRFVEESFMRMTTRQMIEALRARAVENQFLGEVADRLEEYQSRLALATEAVKEALAGLHRIDRWGPEVPGWESAHKRDPTCFRCQTIEMKGKRDHGVECAPGGGQNQAAALTVCRAC